jgi:DNA-directed RNA polymerase specialized sigma24 family protein
VGERPHAGEIRRRTTEEFAVVLDAVEPDEPEEPDKPAEPDPVVTELLDGCCWRELAHARDALAHARERYYAAVRSARTAGFSWGEIGRVLGVSKQQLHRRFGTRQRVRR